MNPETSLDGCSQKFGSWALDSTKTGFSVGKKMVPGNSAREIADCRLSLKITTKTWNSRGVSRIGYGFDLECESVSVFTTRLKSGVNSELPRSELGDPSTFLLGHPIFFPPTRTQRSSLASSLNCRSSLSLSLRLTSNRSRTYVCAGVSSRSSSPTTSKIF